ncbi:hypothetical protein CYMTET_16129 [Cymbomonas tetramitiformis]|uniref:Uncharacterized protein n=1 Tax=Cymbomonas tetramitiformis TaxID=36881 RepID=A0AAE0GD19_9CHLO|nr:hypothetical protein CYMTET_16129 [Cymbomonas tetramitiformis]
MVTKKIKKVVPVIYNEYFTTVNGKLVHTATQDSLQDGKWHKLDNDSLGNPSFLEVVRNVFPANKNRGEESLLQKFTTKTIASVLFYVYSNLLCAEGIGGWALDAGSKPAYPITGGEGEDMSYVGLHIYEM